MACTELPISLPSIFGVSGELFRWQNRQKAEIKSIQPSSDWLEQVHDIPHCTFEVF